MDVESRPYEKLIIRNITECTLDEFIEEHVMIGNQINPKWVNGYLLYFYATENSDYYDKLEHEEKTLVWEHLTYVEMPDYQKTLKSKMENAEIRITDVTRHKFFQDIAAWLKSK